MHFTQIHYITWIGHILQKLYQAWQTLLSTLLTLTHLIQQNYKVHTISIVISIL